MKVEAKPYIPLTAPEMPVPGLDFLRAAEELGGESPVYIGKGSERRLVSCSAVLDKLHYDALYSPNFELKLTYNGVGYETRFLPGNLWGMPASGPRRARVYILGERPGAEEMQKGKNFIGPASKSFYRAIEELGVGQDELEDWYLANAARHLPPTAGGTFSATWFKNCRPLVENELRLVLPDFILCFGAKGASSLFGKSISVGKMVGRELDYPIPTYSTGEDPTYHIAKVIVGLHPAAVLHEPQSYDAFLGSFRDFVDLVRGRSRCMVEVGVHHQVIDSPEVLSQLVDTIVNDPDPESRKISVDCEWHGEEPATGWLRSIQFSHKPMHGYYVKLRAQGGRWAFGCPPDGVRDILRRLLHSTPERAVRPIGQMFRSDMPWLDHFGIYLMDAMRPPEPKSCDIIDLWEAAERTRDEGGMDLYVMAHSHFETGARGLENILSRFTSIPRYDVWVEDKKKELKDGFTGYGDFEDCEQWYSYGCYDVDGPRRAADVYNGVRGQPGLLDADMYGHSCRLGYLVTMLAYEGFYEMELNGISVNQDRVRQLAALYENARRLLIANLRTTIKWNTFNPRSVQHKRELLYGEALNGKIDKTTGQTKRVRPLGSMCFQLEPIKASGKQSMEWEKVVRQDLVGQLWPSTDKEVLGIHGVSNDTIMLLRDVCFLEKLCATNLPTEGRLDEHDEGDDIEEDDADPIKGVFAAANSDGRLRTHFGLAETGRATSFRVNMQNFTKRRESQYKAMFSEKKYGKILKTSYQVPVRSALRAMDGCVLMEPDVKSAELAALAWQCGDQQMIEDVRRNCLDKKDPDYVSIHANMAVNAFRLNCAPTEEALEAIGKSDLYVGAKNVIFGIPYGRGAKAIHRQLREEGVNITLEEVEAVMSGYFERWPDTYPFLESCKDAIKERGWLMTPLERYRRFLPVDSDEALENQKREATNLEPQGIVAEHVSLCLYLIRKKKRELFAQYGYEAPWFNMLLQIHDAVILETRPQYAGWVYSEIIKPCMSEMIPFWPRSVTGEFAQVAEPYHFGVDVKVYCNWGEKMKKEELIALGVDELIL